MSTSPILSILIVTVILLHISGHNIIIQRSVGLGSPIPLLVSKAHLKAIDVSRMLILIRGQCFKDNISHQIKIYNLDQRTRNLVDILTYKNLLPNLMNRSRISHMI